MSDLVQPIAVSKAGSHEDVIHAVAAASVWAYIMRPPEEDDLWAEWLSGPFTKTVRRGTASQWLAALDQCNFSGNQFGEAMVCAAAPRPADDLGLPWSKMQVSGLQREREGWPPRVVGPTFCINPDIEMTTGKTAAQVAHGLFGWYLRLSSDQRKAWSAIGYQWNVTDAAADFHWTLSQHPQVQIRDAGRTEVEPGSLTVIAL